MKSQLIILRAWWAIRWKPIMAIGATLGAMLFAAMNISYYVSVAKDRAAIQAQRRIDAGISVLDNCLQIEALKLAEREDKLVAMKQIPNLDYYKTRPAELAQAKRSLTASLDRFAPSDCYQLPSVVNAQIKRARQPAAGPTPPTRPPTTSRP